MIINLKIIILPIHTRAQLTFQDHINAYTRPTRCVCILPLAYASLLFSIIFNLATEMGAKLDTMGPVSADSLAQQGQDTGTYWRIRDETPQ